MDRIRVALQSRLGQLVALLYHDRFGHPSFVTARLQAVGDESITLAREVRHFKQIAGMTVYWDGADVVHLRWSSVLSVEETTFIDFAAAAKPALLMEQINGVRGVIVLQVERLPVGWTGEGLGVRREGSDEVAGEAVDISIIFG